MTSFVKQLRAKGWTAKAIAIRWGITPQWVSRIGKNPKPIHWDALRGLRNRGKQWKK